MIAEHRTDFFSFPLFGPNASRASLSQQVEAIAHNYCSKDSLDHPILHPLAELLQRELGVLRAACKVKDARNAATVQYEGIVLSLLDLRDAITAWQGENRGQVGEVCMPKSSRTTYFEVIRRAHNVCLLSFCYMGKFKVAARCFAASIKLRYC